MTTNEQWRTIPGHDGYEASSEGRIRNARTGRVLKQHPVNQLENRLVVPMHQTNFYVHRLVAAAWFGEMPFKIEHKDGDYANCRPSNLKYVIRTSKEKEANHNHHVVPWKVTDEKRAELVEMAKAGCYSDEIANRLGCSRSYVTGLAHELGVTIRRKPLKLTDEEFAQVKREIAEGVKSLGQIARDHNLDTSYVSLIRSGKRGQVASEPSDD